MLYSIARLRRKEKKRKEKEKRGPRNKLSERKNKTKILPVSVVGKI